MTAPRRKHPWTAADLTAIAERYPNERCEDIARDLGRTVRGVYMQAGAMGVRKSRVFLSSAASGRMRQPSPASVAHQFKPGCTPWNKGMKGWPHN